MAGRIAYYGNTIKDGLVLSLDAAKRDSYPGSGTTWRDISGFNRNCTLQNAIYYSFDNSMSSMYLDGVDDYISTPALNVASNFTIISWIMLNPGFGVLCNIVGGSDVVWYPAIYSSKASWYTGTNWRSGTTTFVANRWYQVCFRLDNSTGSARHSIYVNGQREYMGTDTYSSGTLYYIGCINPFYGVNDRRFLSGRISYFQLYNIALSDSEVLQSYNSVKGRYGL
jgi:hypothetical protein